MTRTFFVCCSTDYTTQPHSKFKTLLAWPCTKGAGPAASESLPSSKASLHRLSYKKQTSLGHIMYKENGLIRLCHSSYSSLLYLSLKTFAPCSHICIHTPVIRDTATLLSTCHYSLSYLALPKETFTPVHQAFLFIHCLFASVQTYPHQ